MTPAAAAPKRFWRLHTPIETKPDLGGHTNEMLAEMMLALHKAVEREYPGAELAGFTRCDDHRHERRVLVWVLHRIPVIEGEYMPEETQKLEEETTELPPPETPPLPAALMPEEPPQLPRYFRGPARYPRVCRTCNLAIRQGDSIVWDTLERKTHCAPCGLPLMEVQTEQLEAERKERAP
jgi:hypothetical protein